MALSADRSSDSVCLLGLAYALWSLIAYTVQLAILGLVGLVMLAIPVLPFVWRPLLRLLGG